MMIAYWQVWIITRLDNLSAFWGYGAAALYFVFIFGLIMKFVGLASLEIPQGYKDFVKKLKLKLLIVIAVILTIFYTLTPTTKEAVAIYAIPAIANSETTQELQKLPKNMAKFLNKKFQEWVGENIDEEPTSSDDF